MNNESRSEKNSKRKKRKKKRYFLRLLIFLALCVAVYFAVHIDYFSVDGIAVVGNNEISDEEIIKLSQLTVGENIFDVHPWFAERRIKKNLYVEDVEINRKLPNKVEIIVTERSGKAQFLMGKKYVVTDNEGMVLELAKEEQKATLVENITVNEAKVGKTIEVKQTKVYEKAMKLIQDAETGDLFFKKVNIEDNKVQAYIYDGLVCKGKYENVLDTVQSGALKSVVFDLYQKGTESGVINIASNNYCSFTP